MGLQEGKMRIDRFLSDMGLASRKEASLAARRGAITVNGKTVKDSSTHIDPEQDEVCFMGRRVEYHRYVYVMLNKPDGYVSATDDPRLPYVVELLPDELRKMELFPVGRLDRDTVGLMILTNNGALAHRVLSPRHHVEKKYYFKCESPLPSDAERLFSECITLSDGYECKSADLVADSDRLGGVITLTEGKYHQIKRMIAAIGNHLSYLERISFAGIPLDPSLARGEWRFLSNDEKEHLESFQKAPN